MGSASAWPGLGDSADGQAVTRASRLGLRFFDEELERSYRSAEDSKSLCVVASAALAGWLSTLPADFVNQRGFMFLVVHLFTVYGLLRLRLVPAAIADRLKVAPGTVAEQAEAVTVLFADLVGFTPLAARKSPVELVALPAANQALLETTVRCLGQRRAARALRASGIW